LKEDISEKKKSGHRHFNGDAFAYTGLHFLELLTKWGQNGNDEREERCRVTYVANTLL